MKKFYFAFFILFFVLLLASCAELLEEVNDNDIGADHFERYVYLTKNASLSLDGFVTGMQITDEHIYFYHNVYDSYKPYHLVVSRTLLDGTELQQVEIPINDDINFLGARIIGNDFIAVLGIEFDAIFYIEMDFNGNERVRKDFDDLILRDVNLLLIENIVFTKDGNILFTFASGDYPNLYILNINNGSVVKQQLNFIPNDVIALYDGRIIVCFQMRDGFYYREIEITTGSMGNAVPIDVTNVVNIFPVFEGFGFTLLINEGRHLLGYNIDTGEKVIILEWIEAGFTGFEGNHVSLMPDGYIYLFDQRWNDFGEWDKNLFILTRTSRPDIPEVTTITLGGIWLSSDIRLAVADFNRKNHLFQIQLTDYTDQFADETWQAGLLRLRTELITGGGPDILYSPEAALADRGFLVDLYHFIDRDNELNITDFFPNALAAMEGPDGSLVTISNSFGILTMIGKTEDIGHIDSWTTSDLLAIAEEIDQMSIPFGRWMDRGNFLRTMLQFSGDELINWHTREAHLDSLEFIHLLETAYLLPDLESLEMIDRQVSEFTRMNRKEQLMSLAFIPFPDAYQEYIVGLGDIKALGIPTSEGGVHILQPNQLRLGINEASVHKEEAWSFLRRFLLPPDDFTVYSVVDNTVITTEFPIRIDLYDKMIAEVMTPVMEDGEEIPRVSMWFDDGTEINLYAMNQSNADDLRLIVESARPIGRWIEATLWETIEQDLSVFFAGERTAQDTARIIQSRVQVFLNEQQ